MITILFKTYLTFILKEELENDKNKRQKLEEKVFIKKEMNEKLDNQVNNLTNGYGYEIHKKIQESNKRNINEIF